jgi:aspartate-semialdehyde dehydrogenase
LLFAFWGFCGGCALRRETLEDRLPEKKSAKAVVLVGTETLLGREMRDVLSATSLGQDLRLVAAEDEGVGTVSEKGGEPSFLIKLTPASLQDAAVIVLAGPPDTTSDVIELKPSAPLVDLTYAGEDQPHARLRAPMVERRVEAGVPPVANDAIHVVAHPAAIAIALVLGRMHSVFPVRRAVVHIFEPASERGSAGIDELQKQTVSLLSFKSMPKEVFDSQVSFSMLARFGEAAPVKLEDVEARIERHLASLLALGSHAPMPSLRLIQAPVFHGYTASLWMELDNNPGVAALQQTLSDIYVEVRAADTEPPNNVGVAGQKEITIGAVSVDRNHPNAVWMWLAVDNLRLTAQNAAMVVWDLV